MRLQNMSTHERVMKWTLSHTWACSNPLLLICVLMKSLHMGWNFSILFYYVSFKATWLALKLFNRWKVSFISSQNYFNQHSPQQSKKPSTRLGKGKLLQQLMLPLLPLDNSITSDYFYCICQIIWNVFYSFSIFRFNSIYSNNLWKEKKLLRKIVVGSCTSSEEFQFPRLNVILLRVMGISVFN